MGHSSLTQTRSGTPPPPMLDRSFQAGFRDQWQVTDCCWWVSGTAVHPRSITNRPPKPSLEECASIVLHHRQSFKGVCSRHNLYAGHFSYCCIVFILLRLPCCGLLRMTGGGEGHCKGFLRVVEVMERSAETHTHTVKPMVVNSCIAIQCTKLSSTMSTQASLSCIWPFTTSVTFLNSTATSGREPERGACETHLTPPTHC